MTKCYGHEECEYNGQPECRLPDGMRCPHGVQADKPVAESETDIEALIERLNQYSQSLVAFHMGGEFSDMFADAATALSTLQGENEKMRADLEYDREHANAYHEECGQWEAENKKLRAELERVKRERDAAVRQVALISQPNEPLTLEQLRQMDGRPVWIVDVEPHKWYGPGWAIVDRDNCLVRTVKNWNPVFFERYGERWLAYRRPPEGEA